MTIPPSRAELAELYRMDDQVQAAHRIFMATPQAQARTLMQRNDDDGGLVYKEMENATGAPAEPETDWSQWEAWMAGHLANEREAVLNIVNEGVNKMLDQERASIDRDLADLRAENAELKGMIGTVLRLYAGETKTGDVVDLPNFMRRRNDAA